MTKRCKACRCEFTPSRPMQQACSPDCALKLVVAKREKNERAAKTLERKADAAKREKLKSRSDYAREAQTAFNLWVRLRDKDRPCISCGRHHNGQYHAGHFLSVGARPELRYEPSNVWKQCSPCNTHLSGNAVLFRAALVREIGVEKVEWLEGPHEPRKYTADDLKEIKRIYSAKARELLKQQG